MTELTKSQKSAIKHVTSLKLASVLISLVGLASLVFNLYIFFSPVPVSLGERRLVFVIICFSIAILILGYLLKETCNIIKKLDKNKSKSKTALN